MNDAPDSRLDRAEEKGETIRQEQETQSQTALVELGKVSDTQGYWIGHKPDAGQGVTFY